MKKIYNVTMFLIIFNMIFVSAAFSQIVPGKILFSKTPVTSGKISNPETVFKTGDHIYALVKVNKTWKEYFGKKNKKDVKVPFQVIVGKKYLFQYITIGDSNIFNSKSIVFDILPEPSKMKAYKDKSISYPSSYNTKYGPLLFSQKIANLPSGSHKIKVQVFYFGKEYSQGEFEIKGDNFKYYAALHNKLKKAQEGSSSMPAAKKQDRNLERKMMKLVKNARWKNIKKLVITDKDWWLNRVSGGNSRVKSRHMAAAVAAKERNGKCYYSNVTFLQPRLVSGAWGRLKISNTGKKHPLPCKNIN